MTYTEKDEYQLRIELKRRQHMLVIDGKDHQLVNEFYKLKLNNSEVCSIFLS